MKERQSGSLTFPESIRRQAVLVALLILFAAVCCLEFIGVQIFGYILMGILSLAGLACLAALLVMFEDLLKCLFVKNSK